MLWILILLFTFAFSDTQDMINTYCGGSVPCYLCTDGNNISQCYKGKLCPLERQKCIVDEILKIDNGKSFPYPDIGIEVLNRKIRYCARNICTNFVDLHSSGKSSHNRIALSVEVKNYSLRLCLRNECGSWIKLGENDKSTVVLSYIGGRISYTLETSKNLGLRYCVGNRCGSWIKAIKQSSYVCPIGNYQCVKYSDGNYYCSEYKCYDIQSVPTQNTDTPEGINDKKNDGQITDQGCLGTIYIMNGRDIRCRPPGTQTGFSNCCKKTKRWFGLAKCSSNEQLLAKLRSWGKLDGNCHYVGSYCAEKWLGVCVQKKKTYCCFSSPLARIIHEYGRPQLGISWGKPESPNCRGFTPEEFQKLDFSKIDFSEWIEEEVKANITPSIQTSISNVLNNVKSSLGGNNR